MSEFTNRVNWLTSILLQLMKRSLLASPNNLWTCNEELASFYANARLVLPRETMVAHTIVRVRFHRWAAEQLEAKRIKSWLENDVEE